LYDSAEPDIAVIDIGAVSSKLYLSRKGLLMRMHRIRAGGAVATKRISEVLEIDFEKAEVLKHEADKQSAKFSDMKRAHNSTYDRAFREFNQVIREYEQQTGIGFKAVYLAGGGSMFPGLDAYLKDIIGREVLLADPFAKVAYPAFMEDTMKEIGPLFTVALGAAMRTFQ